MLALFPSVSVFTSVEAKTTKMQVVPKKSDLFFLCCPPSAGCSFSSILRSSPLLRTKAVSFYLFLPASDSVFLKVCLGRNIAHRAPPEKKPLYPAVQARSRSNTLPLLAPLSPQLAKSSNNPKREFQAICDLPLYPHPPPPSATFREERVKPLDQSNLFLTHFRAQGLPLQEEGDRNISNTLASGTRGRRPRRAAWRAISIGFRSLGAYSPVPGHPGEGSTNLKSSA